VNRAALYIIKLKKKGLLKPGGTVVEEPLAILGGLAHICNAKGYKCLIVIPETQSQEKIDALKTLGATFASCQLWHTKTNCEALWQTGAGNGECYLGESV